MESGWIRGEEDLRILCFLKLPPKQLLIKTTFYGLIQSTHKQDKGKIEEVDEEQPLDGVRVCNYMSTGAILLADILPALLVKFSGPFLPFYVQ